MLLERPPEEKRDVGVVRSIVAPEKRERDGQRRVGVEASCAGSELSEYPRIALRSRQCDQRLGEVRTELAGSVAHET